MFSGNEWLILMALVAVPAVVVVVVLAIVAMARGGRTRSTATPVAPVGTQSGPPPGWFPDPKGEHDQRYWDGSSWTGAVVSDGKPSNDQF